MKKLYPVLIFFCLVQYITLSEQTESSLISFGPFIGLKSSYNASKPLAGRESLIQLNSIPDAGITFSYRFKNSERTGLILRLYYSTYSFSTRNSINSNTFTENFSYLNIGPSFNFSYISAGFSIGIPLRANWGPDISPGKLNIISEMHLGAYLPVYEDKDAELSIFLLANYMLNGTFKEFSVNDPLIPEMPSVPPESVTDSYNPRVLSLQLGLSYLFNF